MPIFSIKREVCGVPTESFDKWAKKDLWGEQLSLQLSFVALTFYHARVKIFIL